MNEQKKENLDRGETRNSPEAGISRNNTGLTTRGSGFDFQSEYKESFSKSLYYQKMAETSLAYLDKMNPAKEILPEIKNLDETQQKDIKDSLAADMQSWLEMYRSVLNEGKTLPTDIIGMASDLARKDRERLK